MNLIDLSIYRQGFKKDTEEDLKSFLKKQNERIPEGVFEVVVASVHDKNGVKLSIVDKVGGALGFNLIVRNSQNQEQYCYFIVPLKSTFAQVCRDGDYKTSFIFKKTLNQLQAMGINCNDFKESLLNTNGESVNTLIGAQFVLCNKWPNNKVHLEYDTIAKAHFFVKSDGKRFEEGEMALQLSLNPRSESKFAEATAIAYENGFKFVSQMDTTFQPHPTANNNHINEELRKLCAPKEPKKVAPPVVNKTIPPFPVQPKKVISLLDTEPDIEF